MKGWPLVLLMALLGIVLPLGLQHLTVDQTARQAQMQQRQALRDLLPAERYDNLPMDHPLAIHAQSLASSQLQGGYLATLSGQPSAVLLHVQASGYAGPIELLIAIDRDGRLLGLKTLEQAETPSLGGHIGEPGNPWMAAFKGYSSDAPPRFDQMAGATVTSRAVINAVHDALRYFDEHRPSLLEPGSHE
ncbi:RnfABCDGE type electron transport complex subunit G [Pseudomonas sp. MPB23]|uniref:RnfABCDGE type electron transport complex subunit G n=1 Tax=Pseudomonas sp. MPB23 TaxID=3388490 RepID=UPI003984DB8F